MKVNFLGYTFSDNCFFLPNSTFAVISAPLLLLVHLAVVELDVHLSREYEAVLLILLLVLLLLSGRGPLGRLRLSGRLRLLFAVCCVVVCKKEETVLLLHFPQH